MTVYVVAFNSAFDGINLVSYVGPFPTYDSALAYAEGEGEWSVVAVEPAPEEFVPGPIFPEGESDET